MGCPHKEMPGILYPLYKTESCHNNLQLCVIVVATAVSCSAANLSLQQPHHTQPPVKLLLSNGAVNAIFCALFGAKISFFAVFSRPPFINWPPIPYGHIFWTQERHFAHHCRHSRAKTGDNPLHDNLGSLAWDTEAHWDKMYTQELKYFFEPHTHLEKIVCRNVIIQKKTYFKAP